MVWEVFPSENPSEAGEFGKKVSMKQAASLDLASPVQRGLNPGLIWAAWAPISKAVGSDRFLACWRGRTAQGVPKVMGGTTQEAEF